MKCDELKRLNSFGNFDKFGGYYDAEDVDSAIAELKARIQLDDDEMAGFLQLEEECGGGDLRNYIAELKAKLENVQATAYAESVDAGMRERRLKRALWLARGYIMTLLQRHFQRLAYQCNNDDYKKNLLRRRNRFYDLYEKCIKKAEEYK